MCAVQPGIIEHTNAGIYSTRGVSDPIMLAEGRKTNNVVGRAGGGTTGDDGSIRNRPDTDQSYADEYGTSTATTSYDYAGSAR